MNTQLTVSAESFSLNPKLSAHAIQGQFSQIRRLERFNDSLELKTPEGEVHTMAKDNIYILEDAVIQCLDGATTSGGATFKALLAFQVPPLDVPAVHDWQMRYPASQQPPSLSEYALKVQSYALQHRKEYPNASNDSCINNAIVKMVANYGHDKPHLGDIALSELAALWIFRATH